MIVKIEKHAITVTREKGESRLSRAGWAGGWAAEHRLLYWLKGELRKRGIDTIKTTAGREMHMMDEKLPLLRSRKPGCAGPKRGIQVWNGAYMVRGVEEEKPRKP